MEGIFPNFSDFADPTLGGVCKPAAASLGRRPQGADFYMASKVPEFLACFSLGFSPVGAEGLGQSVHGSLQPSWPKADFAPRDPSPQGSVKRAMYRILAKYLGFWKGIPRMLVKNSVFLAGWIEENVEKRCGNCFGITLAA